MAENEEEVEETSKPKEKKSKLLIILIVLISIVLIAGGAAVTLLFINNDAGQKNSVSVESAEETDEEGEGEEDQAEDKMVDDRPAIYISLDPAFVVNFEGGDHVRFLQISVSAMTKDPAVVDLMENFKPVVRNNLIFLFSNQTYDSINSLAGKELLRSEALSVIQQVLDEESDSEGIEAVYFTNFVMQ